MIEELFINGSQVDIEKVDIVRRYISPYFGDVTKLKNNGTYTVKLPLTINNSAIFEHCFRPDMFTVKPYTILRADYYYEGFPIFLNAETKVLGYEQGFIEVQFVYGVDREEIIDIVDTKLNEIALNEIIIFNDEWIIDWNKEAVDDVTTLPEIAKYEFKNYISGEREKDVVISGGTVVDSAIAPEPFLSNKKQMTMHPFVSFNDILDLIIKNSYTPVSLTAESNPTNNKIVFEENVIALLNVADRMYSLDGNILTGSNIVSFDDAYTVVFDEDVSMFFEVGAIAVFVQPDIIDFTPIKNRLLNKGLLISGNEDNYLDTFQTDYTGETVTSQYLKTGNNTIETDTGNILYITTVVGFWKEHIFYTYEDKKQIKVTLDFEILAIIGNIDIYKSSDLVNIVARLPKTSVIYDSVQYYKYKTDIILDYDSTSDYYLFKFSNGSVTVTYRSGGSIKFETQRKKSVYGVCTRSGGLYFRGRFNILYNLPKVTCLDFIQQCLIMTGCVIDTDLTIKTYDQFKTNLDANNVYDWSGKVSNIHKGVFQFNSNAQKNWVKYTNSEDLSYVAKESINVNDATIEKEKDLYTIPFSLAEKNISGITEHILYEQIIKINADTGTSFENKYTGKDNVVVIKTETELYNEDVLPNSLEDYYQYRGIAVGAYYQEDDAAILNDYEIQVYSPIPTFITVGSRISTIDDVDVEANNFIITEIDGTTITINQDISSYTGSTSKFVFVDAVETNYILTAGFKHIFTVGEEIQFINGIEQTGVSVVSVEDDYIEVDTVTFIPTVEYEITKKTTSIGFVPAFYSIYQKLIERPIVVECDVNLGFYESATIDFTKPVYIEEFGKYCMLLELQAPNRELCAAKLLLINQIL